MKKNWDDAAWGEYLYWQEHDRTKMKRINELLKAIVVDEHLAERCLGLGTVQPVSQ
jgi:toxin YoeB